jgi:hypothetical protein
LTAGASKTKKRTLDECRPLREQDPWPGIVLVSVVASILDIITTIAMLAARRVR